MMYYFSPKRPSGGAGTAQTHIQYLFVQKTQLHIIRNAIKGGSQAAVFI